MTTGIAIGSFLIVYGLVSLGRDVLKLYREWENEIERVVKGDFVSKKTKERL